LKQLEVNYKKAQFFYLVYSDIESVFKNSDLSLSSLNSTLIKLICSRFGIDTRLINSSELNLTTHREEKVLDIIKALSGDIYYSGIGAATYQKEENFTERGIELRYSTFKPFEYPQFWGGFESNVSVIDYLMHCGYDWENVLRNQTK
jgi:hypothetical protein